MFGERESRLFKLCPNLPARNCVAGVQAVLVMYRNLPAGHSVTGVGTYLPGTVLHAVMQAV